jgi:dephospho-CoA kinase
LKLPESEIRIRNSEQISTDMKKNLADFVIENNGTISEMLASADFILDLVKLA